MILHTENSSQCITYELDLNAHTLVVLGKNGKSPLFSARQSASVYNDSMILCVRNIVWELDILNYKWKQLLRLDPAYHMIASGIHRNELIIICHKTVGKHLLPSNTMFCVDLVSKQVKEISWIADFPLPWAIHSSVMYNGKLFVIGDSRSGYSYDKNQYLYQFDVYSRTWSRRKVVGASIQRSGNCSVVVNGDLYVMFGRKHGNNTMLCTVMHL